MFLKSLKFKWFQHRDRPRLPVRVDLVRDRVRLQDPEASWHLQRVQVHLLHQHRHHHSLVRIRTSVLGKKNEKVLTIEDKPKVWES